MWDERFEIIIRERLPHLRPDSPLEPGLALSAHGLDSMGMIGLITSLEDEYALTLPDEAIVPANFVTPRTVWEMVRTFAPAVSGEPAGRETP